MDRRFIIKTCGGFKTLLWLQGHGLVRVEDVRQLPRQERLRVLELEKQLAAKKS
jgi:hypothetical protein